MTNNIKSSEKKDFEDVDGVRSGVGGRVEGGMEGIEHISSDG